MRAVARTIQAHHQPAVSRAVHRLVERGVLESMMPTGAGFRPDTDGWQGEIRANISRKAGDNGWQVMNFPSAASKTLARVDSA
jgi:hypothetical protein